MEEGSVSPLFSFYFSILKSLNSLVIIFLLKNHKALLKIIKEYTAEKLTRIIIMNTSCIQIAALLKIFS